MMGISASNKQSVTNIKSFFLLQLSLSQATRRLVLSSLPHLHDAARTTTMTMTGARYVLCLEPQVCFYFILCISLVIIYRLTACMEQECGDNDNEWPPPHTTTITGITNTRNGMNELATCRILSTPGFFCLSSYNFSNI
jgi:hypothetical protein